jgi:radical SAM superfamily enzyme YgiQ (UPF0313 family)
VDSYTKHRFFGGLDVDEITMPILATRGCPYQCTYCSSANMWTPRWIARDPKGVVDEIEHYMERYGARNFPFQDLTAILNREWIIAFCREILARKLDITWQLPTGTRAEAIDEEVALLLKQSGVVIASYSPESGSEETRKLIKKKMRTDRLMDSIRASIAADLNVTVACVVGFPHDENSQIRENLPFLRSLAQLGVSDAAVFYYMALPGTELFHNLFDQGKVRMDRDYFGHILHGLSAWPATSYNDRIGRFGLFVWKLRMTYAFYSSKTKQGTSEGLLASILHAISGLFESKHESRLQTAFRTGVFSLWHSLRVRFSAPWIDPQEERELLASWDTTYRSIREQLQQQRVLRHSPPDSRSLHETNVIPFLRDDHGSARRLAPQA